MTSRAMTRAAVNHSCHAFARHGLEAGGARNRRAPRSRAPATMAAASGCSLACSSPAARRSSVLFVERRQLHARARGRPSFRQRPRLVDDERVDFLEALERFRVPDQHAGAGAATHADHDRHRRREPERARARDDQHGHGAQSACASRGSGPQQRPGDERDERDSDHRRHEPCRRSDRPAAESARASAAPRRPSARSARAACRAPTRSACIIRLPVPFIVAPVTLAARGFLHRDGLAGDHRFVDRAAPFDDDAVDRDLLARPHAQEVADLDVGNRNVDLLAVANRARRLRRHARAARGSPRRSGRARAAPAPDRAAPAPSRRPPCRNTSRPTPCDAEAFREEARRERAGHAEEVRRAYAERDQREHVRCGG